MSEFIPQIFSYAEFTTRNLGFVDEAEQKKLKAARIFIPGVGGMGGTALVTLVRMGIENFIIADLDEFEVSNLNRQIFADRDSLGKSKAQVAHDEILKINPNLNIKVLGSEWTEKLEQILSEVDLVINGCDDVKSTVHLMRAARDKKITVIDAFASVLPSVYVVRPDDPRPEEMFEFPTRHLKIEDITPEMAKECAGLEMLYVLIHSSSAKFVHLKYAQEMLEGKRKRISFAPMVWSTSMLMSYEAVKIILNKEGGASYRGIFMNPWTFQFEKPLPAMFAAIKKILVKLFLKRLGSPN